MEKGDRTPAENDESLCTAGTRWHAAWLQVGTQANRARSEWQCSRVYTVLGLGERALRHARRCLELVESAPEEMDDWDLAAASEALARAFATAGDGDEARRHVELGHAGACPDRPRRGPRAARGGLRDDPRPAGQHYSHSAARSASAIVVRFVFALGISGIAEASTT